MQSCRLFFGCATTVSALSYAWDSYIGSGQIRCQDIPLTVTANCDAALRQLRKEEKVRKLWVDAICIDQSNMEERNDQVKRMVQIYSMAQEVLIWLGSATKESDTAFDHLIQLSNRLNSEKATSSSPTNMRGVIKSLLAIRGK